jgi:hypothetical protein
MLQIWGLGKEIVLRFHKMVIESSSKRRCNLLRMFDYVYEDEGTLFQAVKQLAKSILVDKYIHGKIRIYVSRITLFGYHDWTEFKIRFLNRLCGELEKEIGMDRQRIEVILKDRIEPIWEL